MFPSHQKCVTRHMLGFCDSRGSPNKALTFLCLQAWETLKICRVQNSLIIISTTMRRDRRVLLSLAILKHLTPASTTLRVESTRRGINCVHHEVRHTGGKNLKYACLFFITAKNFQRKQSCISPVYLFFVFQKMKYKEELQKYSL